MLYDKFYLDIATKMKQGLLPIQNLRFSGNKEVVFLTKPDKADPVITIVLHLKMTSFLGDYGAGRTVKTFSLLPGEKTTITVRSYEHKGKVLKKYRINSY